MIELTRRSFLQALGITAAAPYLTNTAAAVTDFNLHGIEVVSDPANPLEMLQEPVSFLREILFKPISITVEHEPAFIDDSTLEHRGFRQYFADKNNITFSIQSAAESYHDLMEAMISRQVVRLRAQLREGDVIFNGIIREVSWGLGPEQIVSFTGLLSGDIVMLPS